MTWATREGVSELRQPSWWRVCSSEGLHLRGGSERLDAVMRARLIWFANCAIEELIARVCERERGAV